MCLLYKNMDIPKSCLVNNTIFKKLFYENASMNKNDKEIFQTHINKIVWKYSFKEETINIRQYKDGDREYDEIALIEVELGENSKYKRIAEIIQRTIPYPLILIFTYKDLILINVTHKRINKNDESKNAVEEFIYTNWIDLNNIATKEDKFFNSIKIKNLSFVNFYKFYSDFADKINIYNAAIYQNNIDLLNDKNPKKIKEITDEIEILNLEIEKLRNKIKREKHFNLKIDYNIKLRKLVNSKEELISKLK